MPVDFGRRATWWWKLENQGGGPISEQIRTILLDVANRGMAPRCEIFLYLASRAQHLADVVLPSLEKGAVVLCDRFSDATVAYQGYGRAMSAPIVRRLNRFATEGLNPDLTLVLDVPVTTGLARKRRAGGLDRLDLEREAFHESVRKGYLRIAKQEPRRVRLIDGTATIHDVSQTVQHIVAQRLRATKNHLTRVESHAV